MRAGAGLGGRVRGTLGHSGAINLIDLTVSVTLEDTSS